MPELLKSESIGKLFYVYEQPPTDTPSGIECDFIGHIMYMFDSDASACEFFNKTIAEDLDGTRYERAFKVVDYKTIARYVISPPVAKTLDTELPVMLLDVVTLKESGETYYKFLQDGEIGYSSVGTIELCMQEVVGK